MKAVKSVEETGCKSWLASVGAYGESVNKSTDTLDKLYTDGNALVHDLIVRGESVEATLKAKLKQSPVFKGKSMLENKIAMLKAKLGMQSKSREIQLEKLSAKVDDLIDVVAKLAQQKAAEQAAAKSAAKTTTKTTTTRKPAAQKSTTRKTAASAKKSTTTTKSATTTKATTTGTRTRKPAAKKPAADNE
ncbi:hypothetical protein [Aliiglaciecola lipolytica]|uniref:Poly(Hydroxyalkanoate) granule-associated protein n=1 Tax=Aliiglaciecola lipolytica E3 TaxID=1127673 RepID=K6YQH2_9ALTE|nr:hypothetical protein [Aliiglaciecola lipolytica]GAC13580.1 hypothetical protein GLIP_0937 [Aliiglaciecola lipolytica E3]